MLYFLGQKSIAINLAALTIIWIAASSNYYTITFMAKYLPGDFNTNMVALFCADLPTGLITWGLVAYLRPQTVIKAYSLLMLCGGLLLLYLVSDLNNLGAEFPYAVASARVGTNGLFMTLWMTHPRFFPTLFCATSMGIANIFARTVVVFAPLIAEYEFPTPLIFFNVLALLAFLSSLFISDEPVEEKEKV